MTALHTVMLLLACLGVVGLLYALVIGLTWAAHTADTQIDDGHAFGGASGAR